MAAVSLAASGARRAGLDESRQRGEAGKGIEIEVLGGHVNPVSVADLAQQQRAGQRVQPDSGAEQRRIRWRVGELRAAGDPGQDLAQFIDDQDAPSGPLVAGSPGAGGPISQPGSSGCGPVSVRRKTIRCPAVA